MKTKPHCGYSSSRNWNYKVLTRTEAAKILDFRRRFNRKNKTLRIKKITEFGTKSYFLPFGDKIMVDITK